MEYYKYHMVMLIVLEMWLMKTERKNVQCITIQICSIPKLNLSTFLAFVSHNVYLSIILAFLCEKGKIQFHESE